MAPAVRKPSTEDLPPADSDSPERGGVQRNDGRRGVRTVVLSAVMLVSLAALAVGVLWSSLGPPEGTASSRGRATEEARAGSALQPSAVEGPTIAGTISVAPELRGRVSDGDILFIIARKGAGGTGAPFAVKRVAGPHFPLEFQLGPGDVMTAGTAFEGNVRVSVRLSRSGVAGPGEPGDLEGDYPGQVAVGARGVNIVIARVR
jgi:cytochrome c-type biogenesis protein CcmH